jgi:hypothetical protein
MVPLKFFGANSDKYKGRIPENKPQNNPFLLDKLNSS